MGEVTSRPVERSSRRSRSELFSGWRRGDHALVIDVNVEHAEVLRIAGEVVMEIAEDRHEPSREHLHVDPGGGLDQGRARDLREVGLAGDPAVGPGVAEVEVQPDRATGVGVQKDVVLAGR